MKFLKKIFCIFLILILFLHVNYLAVYYSLYIFNVKKLTESCCEKKVKDCNAKCFVQKKMNEDNGKNNKNESPEMKLKISEFSISSADIILVNTGKNKYIISDINNLLPEHISDTEYPPKS